MAIVETSSHALELERVRGTHFQVGVFTNLSPEHLNFHGTFEAYRAAKAQALRAPAARRPGRAQRRRPEQRCHARGDRARACSPTGSIGPPTSPPRTFACRRAGPASRSSPAGIEIRTRLVGRFNVSNWLAAYAAATYFGATPDDLARAAAAQAPVPGRMNLVERGQPFAVVVDFAHTPQALQKALDTVRALVSGPLLLAFGLAGGRDFANRPVMGALAARKRRLLRHHPWTIRATKTPPPSPQQIAAGARSAGAREGSDFAVELDRRAAIRLLFERARPGDAVLLAGKGHEQRMVVGDERRPWNDARVAAEVLAELGFRHSGCTMMAVPRRPRRAADEEARHARQRHASRRRRDAARRPTGTAARPCCAERRRSRSSRS